MIEIPGGWFRMGSDERPDERPVHRVRVDRFSLSPLQVTNEDYARFAPPPRRDDPRFNDPLRPVVAVSWIDAVRYCEWLSGLTGRGCRLPTEAEWEYAARGGADGRRYPWGDDAPQSRRDYGRRWRRGPERVGTSEPNAFGLYDLCENVHEWCSDWYAPDSYASAAEENPRGPQTGTRRVSRGGSWRHEVKISRCAARSSLPPEFQYEDYGFRVASSVGMTTSTPPNPPPGRRRTA
ncbi:MAG: formylglycine-generating enzyme family protein [Thermoanaerobaculia bacterium]